jgi:hypothetical protein
LQVAISQTTSVDARNETNVTNATNETNATNATNATSEEIRSYDTERSYLVFREERMERRLNRSKIVLRNLQAREQYVERALTFQNSKAASLVERAAEDQQELHADLQVLGTLALRAPGLQSLANTSLPADVARFNTFFAGVRANLTELLESPLWEQIDEINETYLNKSVSYDAIDSSLNDTEKELMPWEKNYTHEARRLATRHVDGLLLKMADHLSSTVEETTKMLETSDNSSDASNLTSPAPSILSADGEDNAFNEY